MLEPAEKIDSAEATLTYIARWGYDIVHGSVMDNAAARAWLQMCSETWWHAREYARKHIDGDYNYAARAFPQSVLNTILPLQLALVPHCVYPELAYRDGQLLPDVSFFANHADGLRDRRTVTTIGRYLKLFNPHAPDAAIQKACDAWRVAFTPPEVKFTQDPELIERIYIAMNEGCMRYRKENFDSQPQVHPTAVYGNCPGVRLAYLEPTEGKFTARCFVFENPKDDSDRRLIRGFGDYGPLIGELEKQGYRHGSWEGARLRAIPHQAKTGHYVVPYLDGGVYCFDVVDNGEWLLITEEGAYAADTQYGVSYGAGGDEDDEDDHDGEVLLCSHFYDADCWADRDDTVYCSRYDDYILADDAVALHEGDYAHGSDESLRELSSVYYTGNRYTLHDTTLDGEVRRILVDDSWYDEIEECDWHDDVRQVQLVDSSVTRHSNRTVELAYCANNLHLDYLEDAVPWLELDSDDDIAVVSTWAARRTNGEFARELAILFAGRPPAELREWVAEQFEGDSSASQLDELTTYFEQLIEGVILALPQTAEVITSEGEAFIEEEEEVTA